VSIATIDLNRLLVLHAVLEERSIARAAAKLHVTPSAVSNALAQLRATFDDPLVVRSGRGITLTPRAIALAPQLRDAVLAAQRVFEGDRFDPRTTTRTFSLACSDGEQISAVPTIAARMARELPLALLRIMSVEQLASSGGLASGDVDAAIGPAHPGAPGLHAHDLYDEEAVLIVRRDHPRVRRALTRELFNSLRHVDILLALGRGGVGHRVAEEFFASQGLTRDIAVTVPTFTAAAAVVAETDWITGIPRRLAEKLVHQLPIRIAPIAVPTMRFPLQLLWHDRTDADPGARFFRSLILAAVGKPKAAASRARRTQPSTQ
jgi:DNA-binding transcriptional LysR family regulator